MLLEKLINSSEHEVKEYFEKKNSSIGLQKGDILILNKAEFPWSLMEVQGRINKRYAVSDDYGESLYDYESLKSLPKLNLNSFLEYKKQYSESKLIVNTNEKARAYLRGILRRMYPEERYDIINDTTPLNNAIAQTVIVHYPEFETNNSFGMKYPIKDVYLFTKFVFSQRKAQVKVVAQSIERTSFCYRDMINSSSFMIVPHVSADSYSAYPYHHTSICFGDGTPIRNFMNRIKNGFTFYSEIEKYFYAMNDFMLWESVEGVPYIKTMERTGDIFRSISGLSISDAVRRTIVDKMTKDILSKLEPFEFSVGEDGSEIIFTESVSKLLTEYAIKHKMTDILSYIHNGKSTDFEPSGNIKYYEDTFRTKNDKYTDIFFKGERVKYKFEPLNISTEDVEELKKTSSKSVHPVIVSEVKKKIQSLFNTFLIRTL